MENLAELKRVKVGQAFKLVNSYYKDHKLLNTVRKINLVQTNALRFEPLPDQNGSGSWLYFPSAKDFVPKSNGFGIMEEVPVYNERFEQVRDEKGAPLMQRVELLTYEFFQY